MISLEYMAGFFDGEGCICLSQNIYSKRKYIRYTMEVSISQSGIFGGSILKDFKSVFGGYFWKRNREGRKIIGIWFNKAMKACIFLEQILPYLRLKKEQAELAIEFQKILSSYGSYNRNSHLLEIERIEKYSCFETIRQEIRFLKRRA